MSVIDEIRTLTSEGIDKNKAFAKLNLPKLIARIKEQASLGKQTAMFPYNDINEYDKKLLEGEGFNVFLIDMNKGREYDGILLPLPKGWEVSW